jgi:hypothetical protein
MPTYDYHCPANGRTIEVWHSFHTTLTTWEELCGAKGIDPGDTPLDAPIERLIGGGLIFKTNSRTASASCCGVTGCTPH